MMDHRSSNLPEHLGASGVISPPGRAGPLTVGVILVTERGWNGPAGRLCLALGRLRLAPVSAGVWVIKPHRCIRQATPARDATD
jgi:hypothetical protein